jgi:hypothetical protein
MPVSTSSGRRSHGQPGNAARLILRKLDVEQAEVVFGELRGEVYAEPLTDMQRAGHLRMSRWFSCRVMPLAPRRDLSRKVGRSADPDTWTPHAL